jgi:WD40 repeat protein
MQNHLNIRNVNESKNEYELWRTHVDDYIIGIGWNFTNEYISVASSSGIFSCYSSNNYLKIFEIKAHQNGILSLDVSPKENKAVTTGQDGLIKLWETSNNKLLKEIKSNILWVNHVKWSPDGKYFAVGSGNRASVFSNNGELVQEYDSHESTVSAITWNKNSKLFATSCYGGVRLFEIEQEEPIEFLQWKNSMHSLSWSPDGKFIGCGTQDSRVHFFPLPYRYGSDFEMNGYRGKVKILDWTIDSKYFLTNCWDELVVWKFAGKTPQGEEPLTLSGHLGKITQAKFQHNGSFLASGDDMGFVHFYDAEISENVITGIKLKNMVSKICWSYDDNLIAVGTSQGELIIMESPA